MSCDELSQKSWPSFFHERQYEAISATLRNHADYIAAMQIYRNADFATEIYQRLNKDW